MKNTENTTSFYKGNELVISIHYVTLKQTNVANMK